MTEQRKLVTSERICIGNRGFNSAIIFCTTGLISRLSVTKCVPFRALDDYDAPAFVALRVTTDREIALSRTSCERRPAIRGT
jgi:hypothetical protein